jgi:NAD(P)H-dependent flavin oxidoreductase YrpB (nitropropane dioxygenase family)
VAKLVDALDLGSSVERRVGSSPTWGTITFKGYCNMALFTTRYPLIQAAMNQGTSAEFAIAVYNAGAMPSLSGYQYRDHTSAVTNLDTVDTLKLNRDLIVYKKETESTTIMLSFDYDDVNSANFTDYVECLLTHRISHAELIPWSKHFDAGNEPAETLHKTYKLIKILKQSGTKLLMRLFAPVKVVYNVNGLIIKGSEAAGKRGTREAVEKTKHLNPGLPVIPAGGIANCDDVAYYIGRGAEAVVVGTLFAATIESPLHVDAKKQFVKKTSADITVFTEMNQNAIQFRQYEGPDDANHSNSLIAGLYNDPGKSGHAFVSPTGIDAVTDIIPVDTLVQSLVSKLQ